MGSSLNTREGVVKGSGREGVKSCLLPESNKRKRVKPSLARVTTRLTRIPDYPRYSALAACAGSCSPRASVAAMGPNARAPAGEAWIRLVRLTKS